MCFGAMIQARVEKLIYGAPDPKAGAIRSRFQLAEGIQLNHTIQVHSGVLEDECGSILKAFFALRR
jgi:tRNA(adenine34) deaminase